MFSIMYVIRWLMTKGMGDYSLCFLALMNAITGGIHWIIMR